MAPFFDFISTLKRPFERISTNADATDQQPNLELRLALVSPRSHQLSFMQTLAANERAHGLHLPLPRNFLSLSSPCSLPTDQESQPAVEQTDQHPFVSPAPLVSPSPLPQMQEDAAAAAPEPDAVNWGLSRSPGDDDSLGQASGMAKQGLLELLVEPDAPEPTLFGEEKTAVLLEEETEADSHVTKKMKLMDINDNEDKGEPVLDVTTTAGDGQSEVKKIEGLLYRFHEGVIGIMCLCHGTFHTPAEFLKHGGASDPSHPMKHITVSLGTINGDA